MCVCNSHGSLVWLLHNNYDLPYTHLVLVPTHVHTNAVAYMHRHKNTIKRNDISIRKFIIRETVTILNIVNLMLWRERASYIRSCRYTNIVARG